MPISPSSLFHSIKTVVREHLIKVWCGVGVCVGLLFIMHYGPHLASGWVNCTFPKSLSTLLSIAHESVGILYNGGQPGIPIPQNILQEKAQLKYINGNTENYKIYTNDKIYSTSQSAAA